MYRLLSIIILAFLAPVASVLAQEKPREFSPYTRFGIGDLSDPNFVTISQMGGIAAGYSDRNILNPANPASLGSLRNAAFEVGVSTKFTTLTDGNNKTGFFGGGLDYLALGLPIYNPINEALDRVQRKVHIGTVFVLKPYSQVGYDVSQIDSILGTGSYSRRYTGSGGTYEFKWSNGFSFNNFSFGFGIGYLFGKMSYKRELELLSVPLPYSTIGLDEISMKGFRWNTGLQYRFNLKKVAEGEFESSRFLTIGLYGQSSQSFNTLSNHVFTRQLVATGQSGIIDTVRYEVDLEGKGTLPGEVHAGFYYNDKYKVQFGGQMSLISWSAYKNSAKPEILKDVAQISFGFAYCPDIESLNNMLKRFTYRFGVKFGNDPRSFDSKQIKSNLISLGVGMPFIFQRKISFANVAVELGNVGIKDKLNSKFVQLRLGFTLNDDEWFLKKKYN